MPSDYIGLTRANTGSEIDRKFSEALLTSKEAAQFLRMSVAFVREHRNELGGIVLGGGNRRAGRVRFTKAGLERFVAQKSLVR